MTDKRQDTPAALVLGLLAAALLAQNADAQTQPDLLSANFHLPGCQDLIQQKGDAYRRGLCAGILIGLNYFINELPPDRRSCPPDGVKLSQAARVVLAYIERRPQRMHEDFRTLAVEAMHEAWPCK